MEVQQCWCTFFMSHAHFLSCNLVSFRTWKPYPRSYDPLLYVYVCTKSTHLKDCIRPLQNHSRLFKARLGTIKLAGATYSTMHHTYRSIAIPISYSGYMCSYTYPQYTNSTSSNVCLSFSYLGQIRVWHGLLSRSPGHPGQQLWPSFNAGTHATTFIIILVMVQTDNTVLTNCNIALAWAVQH